MARSSDISEAAGMAVIVFDSSMLHQLMRAVRDLGLDAVGFVDVDEAMAYVQHPETSISIVVASGTLPGVLNAADLTTTLSRAYPTLPIVVADHYDGLVESNVMCLDKPWTVEHVGEQVLIMMAKLPVGKRPTVEPAA